LRLRPASLLATRLAPPALSPSSQYQERHTIILLQPTPAPKSRTYLDFSSVGLACDAIVRMFEERLREISPGAPTLT
jgi:hypothetical protein